MQVDAAGCSYNPPEDARQDVIAAEVGKEMSKKLKKQLDPVKAPVSNNEANKMLSVGPHRCCSPRRSTHIETS